MMDFSNYLPLVEVTRGKIVESVHYGAIAVSDTTGKLLASFGDPETLTFLRSASKPIQALPFVELGGVEQFHLTERELAIICASHSGTDEHVAVIHGMQRKIGLTEDSYLCGTHPAFHGPTRKSMILRGEEPTPSRHNCSGKHTGMLAYALMRNLPLENYIDMSHPIQKAILTAFGEMCGISPDKIELGIDGCSVPVFAIPLHNAAMAIARLVDPQNLTPQRAGACIQVAQAMQHNPDMIAGPGRFDTLLMQAGNGKFVSKMGAEGYQLIGLMPGVLEGSSTGVGIAYKIADGDGFDRAGSLVGVEILRQLGVLTDDMAASLAGFDRPPILNQRKIVVGMLQPCFKIVRH
jgi:L-asparaginase II